MAQAWEELLPHLSTSIMPDHQTMEALFKPSVGVPSQLIARVALGTALVWLKLIANLLMTKKTISDCLISSSNSVTLAALKMSLCRVDHSESEEIQ